MEMKYFCNKNINLTFLMLSLIMLLSLGCTSDEKFATSDNVLKVDFSEEEDFYLQNMKRPAHVDLNEALLIANESHFPKTTRMGTSKTDSNSVEVYTKARLGISEDSTYKNLPETLLYIIPDIDNFCHIISADNRTRSKEIGFINFNMFMPSTDNKMEWDLSDFIRSNIIGKMNMEITEYEAFKDSVLLSIYSKIDSITNIKNIGITRAKYPGENPIPSGDGWDCHIIVTYDHGEYHEVLPLLPVAWGQLAPYNYEIWDKTECNVNTSTGCVMTAAGMLMAYWNHPSQIGTDTMNWELITSTPTPEGYIAQGQVARMMKLLGEECNATYSCEGTNAHPDVMKSWLLQHGYQGGEKYAYNKSSVMSSLDLNRPVYIIGDRSNGAGHAWLIDGYKYWKEVYKTTYLFVNEFTHQSFTTSGPDRIEEDILFNNNFGLNQGVCWLADGYFCPEFILNPEDNPADWNYSINTYIYTNYRPIEQ